MNTINGVLTKDIRNIFNQMSVGFDDYWLPSTKHANYPPYNLVEESKNNYRIEMAVAGFSKENIEITEEDNKLTITGHAKNLDNDKEEVWHYNGLAQRSFTRSFNLASNVEVKEVKLENGILIMRFQKDEYKNKKMIKIL